MWCESPDNTGKAPEHRKAQIKAQNSELLIGAIAPNKEPPNGYKLITKDYQRERYARKYMEGGVDIVVSMQYHTCRHYWHVNVYFTYEPHFRTEVVDGLEYTKSRKEARQFAFNVMRKNPDEFYQKLSQHYKDLIKESLKKGA